MRWISLVLFVIIISTTSAEPEPKKYKSEVKVAEKQSNTSLTNEEKKFLREVEEKFGVKSDKTDVKESADDVDLPIPTPQFPAVIAIEIVNDTDSKVKGKRTIDANLGYGYRTNNGYSYNYFGKPGQDKGKFMIYPYSQEDIPPARPLQYSSHLSGSGTSVEIQSSQAFELKEVDDDNSYHYRKPSVQLNPQLHSSQQFAYNPTPTTFYTTYNGEKFSGLSTQFPKVMSNYFVDPSKLLQNPQYQTVGLTQEHLRHHGSQLEQRVVPVLVLRVPSSYLQNPTAELYPNLPQNYPLAQHLNSVNLQELVNNYFQKLGYSRGPQVMSYLNSAAHSVSTSPVSSVAHQQPQTYSSPYIRPTYTQADYSGVQYSAVQPVMAKYPSTYSNYQSSYTSQTDNSYQRPQYQYQYVQQHPTQSTQAYYTQPRYQYSEQVAEEPTQQTVLAEHESAVQQQPEYSVATSADTQGHVSSGLSFINQNNEAYTSEQQLTSEHETATAAVPEYGTPKEETSVYQSNIPSSGYASSHIQSTMQIKTPHYQYQIQIPQHDQGSSQQYYTSQQPAQKETVAIVGGHASQPSYDAYSGSNAQSEVYHQQVVDDTSNALPLSETHQTQDHTQATVLPFKPLSQNSPIAQSVSYVTPVPYPQSYHSKYRVMVPQTVFRNVSSEKVHYVNSHSLPESAVQIRYHGQNNPEEEYTVNTQYIPVSRQKPPSYPRNYHSHPKRMTRPEYKDSVASSSKKSSERSEKKKSS